MARYRKIEVRTWSDEKFRRLSPLQPSGQALWLFLVTGPHTGPIPGLFRAGRAGMAEELGWELEAFDEAFSEASLEGMVKADWKSRLVWLPKAIAHNKPESPNVVLSWRDELDILPECDLKTEAVQSLFDSFEALGPSYLQAFEAIAKPSPKPSPKPSTKPSPKPSTKPSPKPMPNQEQQQQQEQEQQQEQQQEKAAAADLPRVHASSADAAAAFRPVDPAPGDEPPPTADPTTARAIELTAMLRKRGAGLQASNPIVRRWAESGVSDGQALSALETAEQRRQDKGSAQPINAGLIDAILSDTTPPARAGPGRRRSTHDERAHTIAVLTGKQRDERTNATERDITGEATRVA